MRFLISAKGIEELLNPFFAAFLANQLLAVNEGKIFLGLTI